MNYTLYNEEEAQLMLTNPHDAFRDQSRSPKTVPFDMLGMLCY